MSKFKVGDEVVCIDNASVSRNLKLGETYIIKYASPINEVVSVLGIGGAFYEGRFELVTRKYPNPPHKHDEIIKAWADGAEIEYKAPHQFDWHPVESPSWYEHFEYRIKPTPTKSPAQLKLEKLEEEQRKLADQIAEVRKEL